MIRTNSNNSANLNNSLNKLHNNPWKTLHLQQSEIPGPRAAHSCEVIRNKLYFFGGWNGKKALNDMFICDLDSMKWTEPDVGGIKPCLRNNHATCTHGKYLYLHGGHNGEIWLDDFYVFDTVNSIWNKINTEGNQPSARACHTLSRVDKKIFLFGGYDGSKCYNNLEVFDIENKSWETLNCNGFIPLARNAHSISVVGKKLFLFGGHSGNKHLKDLFIFDTVLNTWTEPNFFGDAPEGLRGHTSTYIATKIVIFGGYDGKGRSKELFLLNLEDMVWSHVYDNDKFPSSRQRHSSVVLDNRKILIFGGFDGMKWLNDMHILDVSILTDNLRCINSAAEFMSDMNSLINNEEFADVVFKIKENKIIYGHKAIISKRSNYFYELFKARYIEIRSDNLESVTYNNSKSMVTELVLEDLSESILLNILEFIYCGSLSNDVEFSKLTELLLWSNKFQLKELICLCENSFVFGISSDNVVETLISSYENGLNELKSLCINFILSNFHDVSKNQSFYNLESYPSLLMEVMMLSLNRIESD